MFLEGVWQARPLQNSVWKTLASTGVKGSTKCRTLSARFEPNSSISPGNLPSGKREFSRRWNTTQFGGGTEGKKTAAKTEEGALYWGLVGGTPKKGPPATGKKPSLRKKNAIQGGPRSNVCWQKAAYRARVP